MTIVPDRSMQRSARIHLLLGMGFRSRDRALPQQRRPSGDRAPRTRIERGEGGGEALRARPIIPSIERHHRSLSSFSSRMAASIASWSLGQRKSNAGGCGASLQRLTYSTAGISVFPVDMRAQQQHTTRDQAPRRRPSVRRTIQLASSCGAPCVVSADHRCSADSCTTFVAPSRMTTDSDDDRLRPIIFSHRALSRGGRVTRVRPIL